MKFREFLTKTFKKNKYVPKRLNFNVNTRGDVQFVLTPQGYTKFVDDNKNTISQVIHYKTDGEPQMEVKKFDDRVHVLLRQSKVLANYISKLDSKYFFKLD